MKCSPPSRVVITTSLPLSWQLTECRGGDLQPVRCGYTVKGSQAEVMSDG